MLDISPIRVVREYIHTCGVTTGGYSDEWHVSGGRDEGAGVDQTDRGGWLVLIATRGSHRQYKHLVKAGRVTVPGQPSDDLAPGTLNSILKQAGLKEKR